MAIDRRTFVAALGAATISVVADAQSSPAERTRLILLGTGGGPRPRRVSSASSQVIICNGEAHVIDCGDGVARQLAMANVPLDTLRQVFITHHHSDHNADYGNLLLLAWAAGLRTPVDSWGPPPLSRMTSLFLELNDTDISTRIADEQRPPLAPLIRPHELTRGGIVMQDDALKVACVLVNHPPFTHAFGYRFDAPDRSIVISGDTTYDEGLLRLAEGADVLVHDALYLPGVDRLVARVPNAPALKASILSHHTSAEDAGRLAQAAGVRTLVLSHLVPPDDPAITDAMWVDAARTHFSGRIVVGHDLLEL